jgi:hypothetical protein
VFDLAARIERIERHLELTDAVTDH